MKPYTGGALNWLNGKEGISAPYKSVPVMALIKVHNPRTHDELYHLIAKHATEKCSCGIKSQGSIEDFGKNLYESQKKVWGSYKFTLQQCIKWEYDLFVIQSLKGKTLENKVKTILQESLDKSIKVEDTNEYIDDEIRVDIEIKKNGKCLCGIQVKPSSFENVRGGIIYFNKSANKKFGSPVFYIYYDYDSENLLNINQIIEKIQEIAL